MESIEKENLTIELMNCTEVLLKEITDSKMHQNDVAKTYALAIRSSERTDWRKVNDAIINRWSASGLGRIKRLAWSGKCFEI